MQKDQQGIEKPLVATSLEEDIHPQGRGDLWITVAILLSIALLLILVRRILSPFVIGAVLAYVFSPVVGRLQQRTRLPRTPAVFLFLLLLLGPMALLFWFIEPALVRETRDLAANAPTILNTLLVELFGGKSFDLMGQTIDERTVSVFLIRGMRDFLGTPAEAFRVAESIVGALLDAFLSLVLLFYFLVDPQRFAKVALQILPPEYRPHARRVGRDVHLVLGRYIRGLLFLIVLMSAATWLGLAFIFHLPYSIPIAIATGFLEIIPFVGPVIAATTAAVVGLTYGGTSIALWILVFYFVLRETEDQLVMPMVIGHAVEIHPAVAIFAVLAGTTIAGWLGALLAIPTAAAIKIAFEHWRPM